MIFFPRSSDESRFVFGAPNTELVHVANSILKLLQQLEYVVPDSQANLGQPGNLEQPQIYQSHENFWYSPLHATANKYLYQPRELYQRDCWETAVRDTARISEIWIKCG